MSNPTRRDSGATFKIPYISEEQSLKKSYENLTLAVEKTRSRSCSPNSASSSDMITGVGEPINQVDQTNQGNNDENENKPSTGAIPKIKTPASSSNKGKIQVGMDRYITILKRQRSPTSTNVESSAKLHKSKVSDKPNTENRFSILQNENDESPSSVKLAKPPPMYLREKNSNALVQNLVKLIGENSFYVVPIKRGNIDETKIQINGENDYRKVVAAFEKENKSFYTYQLKSSKGLQVVLKGIDSNVEPSEIKQSLEAKGFKPKNIFNIRNREKIPQPLFHVELEPGDLKIKKNETHPIYDLKYLLHRRITVEEPHKRSGPVQCMNCQEFGHTKAYCKLPSVCVGCGEMHTTSHCNKSNVKKCSNCGGNHTANYRGCPVYTTFKKSLAQPIKISSAQAVNTISGNLNCPPVQKPYHGTGTFAEVLRKNQALPQASHPHAIKSNRSCPPIQQPVVNVASYAGVLKNNQANQQGSQSQKNPELNRQTPFYNFARLESTIETLVQTVNNFTTSMTTMMQEMMRMQSMLLQAVLNKP